MKPNDDSVQPSTEAISRRVAMGRVVVAGLGLAVLPGQGTETVAVTATAVTPTVETEFVPENDYPYFGYEPTQS